MTKQNELPEWVREYDNCLADAFYAMWTEYSNSADWTKERLDIYVKTELDALYRRKDRERDDIVRRK